jgi:hypothetical protein
MMLPAAADEAGELQACIGDKGDLRLTIEDADPERKAEGVYDGEIGWGDYLLLRLFRNHREIMTSTVASTYGLWKGCFVEDARGKIFILLEIGRGRGTRARVADLTVYVREQSGMIELGRVLVGFPTDDDADLVYDYRISRFDTGGIAIDLLGRYDFFNEDEQTPILSVQPPPPTRSMRLTFGR